MYCLASYDDSGVTGHKSCYVMEKGVYRFFAGADIRNLQQAGSLEKIHTEVLVQCGEALAPIAEFMRMKPGARKENGEYETVRAGK